MSLSTLQIVARASSALLVGALGAACSAQTDAEAVSMPASCEAYTAAYESCVVQAAPSLPEVARVAKDRAALASRALAQETMRVAALPAESRAVTVAALAKKCADNLKHLNATCHASHEAAFGEAR